MSNRFFHSISPLFALVLSVSMPAGVALAQDEILNVYSARKEALILPLLERFSQETGILVNLTTGKADGLLKRIEIEGSATPADVFITVDAGRLHRAKAAKILQPIESETVKTRVPAHLRDIEDYWTALSRRARTVIFAAARVDETALSTYEDLADDRWKGRICMRSSGNIYNQSLVASMLEANGVETTEKWARALVDNFARPPTGGDTDQLKAVAAGQCDLTIANTYYFGRLAASSDDRDRDLAAELRVFWPNQEDRGTHVNISGIGIVKYSKHVENAIRLIEFLLTPDSQQWYAAVNHEYPVVEGTPNSEILASLGAFRSDSIHLSMLGVNNRKAVELMDRAGWR